MPPRPPAPRPRLDRAAIRRHLTRRNLTGFAFIYLAGLCWIADVVIPFTGLPHKPVLFVAALVVAEASFLIGVAIIGKGYYETLKTKLLDRFRR